MAKKAIQGSDSLAKKIRQRRHELGLTIEEAAARAGVGTKTWSRYETGGSIRVDKLKGVCKALNWTNFPEIGIDEDTLFLEEYKNHEAWSEYLENLFGSKAAFSFAVGSDILYDYLKEDIAEISSMPKGTHIGQLSVSWLSGVLPEQFLMYYDYDFLYQMMCRLELMRRQAHAGNAMIAHSVLEELILYICYNEANDYIELCDINISFDENDLSEDWVFDLFDDMDIVTFLYSNYYLQPNDIYHFSHWTERQFFTNQN